MAELIGEIEQAVVDQGFSIVPLVTSGRGHSGRQWVRMIHPDCGDQVDFTSPTDERVREYLRIHDCDARCWARGV